MITGQSTFLQSLGWALLNSLWQMALLWVTYQCITGVFRKTTSSQKSGLATAMVFTGFGWFVFTFISILNASVPDNGAITAVVINAGNNEQLNNWLRTMLPVASLIYLFLLVLPVFNFARNYRYVQAIRKFELSKADIEWRIFVKNIAARMGIKKPVQIWLSGLVTSPVTIGYLKPVILLPLAAVNQLSTQQTEAIILHELAHIRRYDYLLNLCTRFIQSILYFNPFIKAFVNIIEREREKSCDEMVMQFQYDPYGYATALLTLEKAGHSPKSLAVAASGGKNDLLHRIEYMLGVQKKQVLSFNKLAGLLAGLLCFIAFNALLIMSRPVNNSKAVASLTRLSSPFYLYTGSEENTVPEPAIKELPASTENTISPSPVAAAAPAEEIVQEAATAEPAIAKMYQDMAASAFMNVAFKEMPAVPVLNSYQEEQVKEVLEASRRVLEEKQWKEVEKKMADAMTLREKSLLKNEYEKQMSRVNWEKMEDRLKMAYDQIAWNKVNEELNKALVEIKVDSLKNVYSIALSELTSLQKELCENNLEAIPDTDISLKTVEQSKKDIQQAINKLKKTRTKKIVHL